jgi:hypothetical protein
LTAAYHNRKDGYMLGSFRIDPMILRPETMEALVGFIKMAEEDFGKWVFGDGSTTLGTEIHLPESNKELVGLGGK